MNYTNFSFNMLKVNCELRAKKLNPDNVDVMITKSSGDTLVCFMDGEEVITYFKVD